MKEGHLMKNYEILKHYKKSDLRRLAKGKTSEIVGIDSEKILIDLSKVLGNYESIKNNVEFRKPPTNTILEVLFDAPNHCVKIEDLKQSVTKKIAEYQKISKDINLEDSNKRYRLYTAVLNAAWDYEGDLLPAEANILRVLRNELSISRKEHQYMMAHPQIKRLFFNEEMYRYELEFLSREGIILVCKLDNDDYFILSDETVDSLKELWGIELEHDQFIRLVDKFNNSELSEILKIFNLPISGNHENKVNRIILEEIKPSEILYSLPLSQLSSYLKRIDISQSGRKEEKILKIIDHFKNNRDIVIIPPPQIIEPDIEDKILSEEKRIDLFSNLTTQQLSNVLGKLNILKSGQKNILIYRLANCQYNEINILNVIKLNDIKSTSRKLGVKVNGTKANLIDDLISYYSDLIIKESKLPTKELFNHYIELSCQDVRIYSQAENSEVISTASIALDFERVTKYLFKNVFKLEIKTQRFGKEDPDGIIKDDEGNIFFYECKTVLNPPYKMPIAHRLQIRNYIEEISKTKDKENFKGYIIISHSFSDNIMNKIEAINSPLDAPICVIEAKDLAAFANKWETNFPTDTFPIRQIVKNGIVTLKDFDQALH
ncbi:MAG: hypothetical protein C5S44_07100 [Candidatus Methanocomedens sp.]|nr:MAG: hypothetical protein C5S44_07100 [ANME-2 cluster archaeon]